MENKPTQRQRSPNYPAYSLEAAVDLVGKLYNEVQRSSVSTESAALALGSKSLSGPARSKVAAMRHFGLVEDAGKAKLRVTDLALDIIHKVSQEQYEKALHVAALSPPLFAELWEKLPMAGDGVLRNYLVKERKFIEDGATQVIQSWTATKAFAKLGEMSYNGSNGDAVVRDTPPEKGRKGDLESDAGVPKGKSSKRAEEGSLVVNLRLIGGVNAHVELSGNATPIAIDRLMEHLRMLRDDLAYDQRQADECNEGATE